MIENRSYKGLRAILFEKGISESKLANLIGMNVDVFNKKINRIKGCDFELYEALKISSYLNVSVDAFF